LWNSRRGRTTGFVRLVFSQEQPPYLLTSIDNGAGLLSEIRYRSAVDDYAEDRDAGETWTTNFPFPLLIVAGTTETDAVSGRVAVTDYRYHEAHFEPRTRQFQGFRRTERVERGDESRPDTRTVFTFLMGQERLPGNSPAHAALNGMLARTEVFGDDGSAEADRPYRVEAAEYDLDVLDETADGRRRVFVFARVHRVEDRERTDDVRGEEKTYDYDTAIGNVVREAHRGYGTIAGAAQPERRRLTETTYAIHPDPDHWLIDKLARVVVRDESGAIIAETRRFYDGADFTGLPAGEVDRGLLSREMQLALPEAAFTAHYAGMDTAALGYIPDTDADGNAAVFVASARKAYIAQGLVRADRDAVGTESSFQYDADGLFRTTLTTLLGETVFVYDRAVGQQTRITYPDGSETRVVYDAQGRILATVLPGEPVNAPPRVYSYDDAAVPNARTARLRHGPGAAGIATDVTYFDGYGKEFQQRVETEGGQPGNSSSLASHSATRGATSSGSSSRPSKRAPPSPCRRPPGAPTATSRSTRSAASYGPSTTTAASPRRSTGRSKWSPPMPTTPTPRRPMSPVASSTPPTARSTTSSATGPSSPTCSAVAPRRSPATSPARPVRCARSRTAPVRWRATPTTASTTGSPSTTATPAPARCGTTLAAASSAPATPPATTSAPSWTRSAASRA
ncbi:MAG: hypothetical protein H0W06_07540, partial [Chloroflexia bacterium]|nr:hypothetical protein [Chloroflexia bacterium]